MAPRSASGIVIPLDQQASRTQHAPHAATRFHNNGHSTDGVSVKNEDEYNHMDDGSDYEDDDYLSEVEEDTFVPRPKLPNPQIRKRNMQDLMVLLEGPYLDLNPEYQRDVVWTHPRMTGLINSLMETYYIPPIIFNLKVEQSADGRARNKRICVDGKQRLSSVQAFMLGKIPCNDKHGRKWYYNHGVDADGNEKVVKGSRKLILPERTKEEFRKKEFVCWEYADLQPEQEEDLFGRVQMGIQLTPAEKIRATSGPWQDYARLFEEDFRVVVNLSRNVRSLGFMNLLICFAQIYEVQSPTRGDGIPQLRKGTPYLEKFVQNKTALDESTKSHLAWVFNTFKELVEQDPQAFKNNNYRMVKTFAPIELVAVAVLISMYGEERNNDMLLGDIYAMRRILRENNLDLRTNDAVWRSIWRFLDDLEAYRGAVMNSQTPARQTAINPLSRKDYVSKSSHRKILKTPITAPKPPPSLLVQQIQKSLSSAKAAKAATTLKPAESAAAPLAQEDVALEDSPATASNSFGGTHRSTPSDSVLGGDSDEEGTPLPPQKRMLTSQSPAATAPTQPPARAPVTSLAPTSTYSTTASSATALPSRPSVIHAPKGGPPGKRPILKPAPTASLSPITSPKQPQRTLLKSRTTIDEDNGGEEAEAMRRNILAQFLASSGSRKSPRSASPSISTDGKPSLKRLADGSPDGVVRRENPPRAKKKRVTWGFDDDSEDID